MDETQATRVVEAILFASGEPVALKGLAEALPDVDPPRLRELLQALAQEYVTQQRAVRIQEVAGGYQLVTDDALAPWVRRALKPSRPEAVSRAAMETLAIVAYRQPITKAELEVVRGVDVAGALETLLERSLIRVTGRKDTPGRPFLYSTTTAFLQHLGLKSLEELPAMPPSGGPAPAAGAPQPDASSSPAEPPAHEHVHDGTRPQELQAAAADAVAQAH